ncbi:MAG: hypothetical protein B9S34_15945 [Opitutia bacterium Tous-C1TDCM]|nr:MAG: hypothetical protein B9S34_15945 [Opitutae bacterium Tous-C1TDCM]
MLKDRMYYAVKPLLPWSLRIALRRIVARRIARRSREIWPINPAAANPPPDWPGWPDGKQFAVVLTHDVEGPRGLARCAELANREAKLGFRSSFNFIPEGSYQVGANLRRELDARNFEIGVHDLKHDGRLYANREAFRQHARQINRYLAEWQAVGFRSGFMYHNLDWLHDLDADYDASTFDTDPFEPQPDAADTIFPFWVESPAGTAARKPGYVELPYTLPQDSTLFMIFQESAGTIWKEKVDWLVRQGGMVLVNVHPDYLHLGHATPAGGITVMDHYVNLLGYLKDTYPGAYWHALPREVAAYVRAWKKIAPALPSAQ